MNDSVKVAVPNYSKDEIAAIIAASPLNKEKAEALGNSFTPKKSWRSIVSKASQIEGVVYESKPKPTKKVASVTKPELVKMISDQLRGIDLTGLEKATAKPLSDILECLRGMDFIELDHNKT